MPKSTGVKKKDKNKVVKLPDQDVFIAFDKLKNAEGQNLVCEKDKYGSVKLYKVSGDSKVLLGIKGSVDGRKIIMVNLDYPDPKMVLNVGSYGQGLNELYDLKFNPLLFSHLQESWNERKRQRDVESGSLL